MVHLREEADPRSPGPGEALVELELSPIDPIDRLKIFGAYPGAPTEAWTPGAEGCGRVVEVGPETDLEVGRRVVLPIHEGAWKAFAVHPSKSLCPLPEEVSPEVAATLRINGLSAWVLLTEILDLEAGDWLLQAPGNGGLGRYMIQLARYRGVKTLSIVRDLSVAADLEALGADRVMTYDELAATRPSDLCDGAELRVAIDGVGGRATATLGRQLGPGGRIVNYGGTSRQPPQLAVAELVFRRITLGGFWLRDWTRDRPAVEIQGAMQGVGAIGPRIEAEAIYPFSRCRDALEHARSTSGRIFLRPDRS